MMQDCLLILSMHRSGSSCMTGCMSICGLSLGEHASQVKNKFNQKGYFENENILGFNESVLSDIGGSWKSMTPLTSQQIQKSLNHSATLLRILRQEFGDDNFAIKDPRIAILQDLYFQALSNMHVRTRILRLRRDIDAVCQSLKRAQNVEQEQCVHLDSLYQTYIDRAVTRAPSFEVDFASLLDDPQTTVRTICDFAGMEFSKHLEIKNFVEKGMVNF